MIDKLEARIRGMSPEERRMQARSGLEQAPSDRDLSIRLPLVKRTQAGSTPRCRSAIQVLSLKFDYSGDLDFRHPEATENPAPLRVWETVHRSTWTDLRSALAQ